MPSNPPNDSRLAKKARKKAQQNEESLRKRREELLDRIKAELREECGSLGDDELQHMAEAMLKSRMPDEDATEEQDARRRTGFSASEEESIVENMNILAREEVPVEPVAEVKEEDENPAETPREDPSKELRRELKNTQRQLDTERKTTEKQAREIDNNRAEINGLRKVNKAHATRIEKLEAELNKLKTQKSTRGTVSNASLEKKISDLDRDLATRKDRIEKLEKSERELRDTVSTRDGELKTEREEVERLKARVAELESLQTAQPVPEAAPIEADDGIIVMRNEPDTFTSLWFADGMYRVELSEDLEFITFRRTPDGKGRCEGNTIRLPMLPDYLRFDGARQHVGRESGGCLKVLLK